MSQDSLVKGPGVPGLPGCMKLPLLDSFVLVFWGSLHGQQ